MSTQLSAEPTVVSTAEPFGRRGPLIGLIVAAIYLGLHHGWIMWQQSTYTAFLMLAVLVMPALAAVSLVGLIYPPIFYTMTGAGKQLPVALKVLAGLIALAGAACGVYLGQLLYHFL